MLHKQALDALDLFKRYDFPKQTKQLISDYYEAQRELERTMARTRSRLAQTQAKLESSKARYDLQQEHVAKHERQIAACTIRAPSPGIAIYGTSADWYQRREDPIEVGDMVRKGQKIFTIPNSALMGVELTAAVEETLAISLPVMLLAEAPSLNKLCNYIIKTLQDGEQSDEQAELQQMQGIAAQHGLELSDDKLSEPELQKLSNELKSK